MKHMILTVDDEREVLDNVAEDLKIFEADFEVEVAESAGEALEVIGNHEKQGGRLALILCDHMMPGTLGVDLLVQLNERESTKNSKKILLTGQASHQDTIKAVNSANLDHYISKPWKVEDLQGTLIKFLTDFVLEADPHPEAYTDILDSERIFAAIYERGEY